MAEHEMDKMKIEQVENVAATDGATLSPSASLRTDQPIDPILEAKIRRKLDFHIIPWIFGLWLLAFIDRSNIGNARIDGLTTQLHLTGTQFNVALAIFYVSYIIVEVPANLVLKRARPRIFLPGIMIGWGVVGTLMGIVKSYEGLLAARFFLGMFEGGLLGGLILYLSTFYRRHELLYRVGLFYTAAPLSGAFGGLLASGIAQMRGIGGLLGWSWIFIIEGIVTVIFGVVTIFFLPNDPGSASFLTSEERTIAVERLILDGGVTRDDEAGAGFKGKQVWRAVANWNTWLTAMIFFCLITPIYSFSLFLPTILKTFTASTTKTQLLSVPPYICGAMSVLTTAHFSDRFKRRGYFIMLTTPLGITGYLLLLTSSNPTTKYVGTFLASIGIFPGSPTVMAWLSNNLAPHYTRATGTALQLAIANMAAFVATFTYVTKDAPAYKTGHAINLGFLCVAWLVTAGTVWYNRWENKVRDAGGRNDRWAEVSDGEDLGYRHPEFRMTI
ncbi:hypothetical protein YB2330_006575 [Saitoella coloradoensis]